MATVTVSEIQEVYGEQEPALASAKKTALKNIAERIVEDIYGGRVTTQAEIEGDADDFARWVGAHLWKIAEGGPDQSQSQTGGSVNFNPPVGQELEWLQSTHYGQVASGYLRSQGASTGIVRSRF